MAEESSATVPSWLLVLTLAMSSGFFVAFGDQIFDVSDLGECTGLISCTTAGFAMIGAIFQFVFFGAFVVSLPGEMAVILFILVNVPWIIIVYKLIASGVEAILP